MWIKYSAKLFHVYTQPTIHSREKENAFQTTKRADARHVVSVSSFMTDAKPRHSAGEGKDTATSPTHPLSHLRWVGRLHFRKTAVLLRAMRFDQLRSVVCWSCKCLPLCFLLCRTGWAVGIWLHPLLLWAAPILTVLSKWGSSVIGHHIQTTPGQVSKNR